MAQISMTYSSVGLAIVFGVLAIVAGCFWIASLVKQNKVLENDDLYYTQPDTALSGKGKDSAQADAQRRESFEGAVVALLLAVVVLAFHGHVLVHM